MMPDMKGFISRYIACVLTSMCRMIVGLSRISSVLAQFVSATRLNTCNQEACCNHWRFLHRSGLILLWISLRLCPK